MRTMIQPLYACRVEDLGPGEMIRAECLECGRVALLTGEQAMVHPRVKPYMRVLDLKHYLKCSGCGVTKRIDVTVRRGGPR